MDEEVKDIETQENKMVLDEEAGAMWFELWKLDNALAILASRRDDKEREFVEMLRTKFGIEDDNYEFIIHEDHVEVVRTTPTEESEEEDNNDSSGGQPEEV